MSLYGMMRTSASGMSAQANRLGAVSDNVANSSTVGYKSAAIEFSTLVLEGGTSDYAPGAVESKIRHQISSQGAFRYTASVTDVALKGDGFLVVQASDGRNVLTRAGSFIKNGDGELVNAAGFKLLGYEALNGSASTVVNGTAGLVPVNLDAIALQSNPSTTSELTVNVPADAAVVAAADLPSANAASASYTAKTSLVVYDNLGREVVLDAYWANAGAGNWDLSVFDRAAAGPGGGFPYSSGPLVNTTLAFDNVTGKLVTPAAGVLSINVPNGATMSFDVSKSTQLATNYVIVNATANGNAPSSVENVEIAADGTVAAVLGNGARIEAYKIPVARVVSPDNLIPVAGNAFLESETSGNIQIGEAGSGGFATIFSSALEQSTVDLASELTDMIQAQSSYTANSKVFQTGADLVSVLNNLRS